MIIRRADVDLIDCSTGQVIFSARMELDARPRMAEYWKFNMFSLDRRDSRQHLIRLVHRELVGQLFEIGGGSDLRI